MIDHLFCGTVLLGMVLVSATLAVQGFLQKGTHLFRRKVGPTYWGIYSWASAVDTQAELQIELPKPSRCIDPAYGGNTYASGKAVKSAKG